MLLMGRNDPDDPLPTIIMDIDGGGLNCTVDHPFTGITNEYSVGNAKVSHARLQRDVG